MKPKEIKVSILYSFPALTSTEARAPLLGVEKNNRGAQASVGV